MVYSVLHKEEKSKSTRQLTANDPLQTHTTANADVHQLTGQLDTLNTIQHNWNIETYKNTANLTKLKSQYTTISVKVTFITSRMTSLT